jgi:S-adenosylmethionine:tRNA ribosyltransferase-isomerase
LAALEHGVVQISEFDFDVPSDLIAVSPLKDRASARMMVVNRETQTSQDYAFRDLPDFLNPGDLIVVNETKVLPVRFRAKRVKTGAALEGLLLPSIDGKIRAWLRGKALVNDLILIEGWKEVRVIDRSEREVFIEGDLADFVAALMKAGEVPIPPYIVNERRRRENETIFSGDADDYQSIFARQTNGFSSAAPTASLHFDRGLIEALSKKNISLAPLTLHVGASTFMPIETKNLEEHRLPFEIVSIPESTWIKIQQTRAAGNRVIGLGTTVARSLESASRRKAKGLQTDFYETDLFIHPPFKFECLDGLITNFHWGRSSLLVLVATFLESSPLVEPKSELRGFWKFVYEKARSQGYRFYSFGDGMLIL